MMRRDETFPSDFCPDHSFCSLARQITRDSLVNRIVLCVSTRYPMTISASDTFLTQIFCRCVDPQHLG